METGTLSPQLEARAPRLATASVEWMYQDPFWEEALEQKLPDAQEARALLAAALFPKEKSS